MRLFHNYYKSLVVVLLLFVPGSVTRIIAIDASYYVLSTGDLRGFFQDLWLGGMVFVACKLWKREVGWVSLCVTNLLLSIMYWGNFEHTVALNALMSFGDVGQLASPTVVKGSLLTVSSPFVVAVLILQNVGLFFFARKYWTQEERPMHFLGQLGAISLLLATTNVWFQETQRVAFWRQNNVLVFNANVALTDLGDRPDSRTLASSISQFEQNLNGVWTLVPSDERAKNVLIVFIEGHSHSHVQPERLDLQQASGSPWMPKFSALARESIHFEKFVSVQRQTNRCEYATLCGDFPNLFETAAKMDLIKDLMKSRNIECLPKLLQNNGYKTAYIQSALLEVMHKDEFMPEAGFMEVLGRRAFRKVSFQNHWGVSDFDLYRKALEKIEEYNKEPQPWFMAILTVGTHHPFQQPPEYKGKSPFGPYGDSLAAADDAVTEFVATMEKQGILKNTLVLIMGDESFGRFYNGREVFSGGMETNWSSLTILEPHKTRKVVKEVFTQTDIAVSIADYLGIPQYSFRTGRSIFRTYKQPRPILFANFLDKTVSIFRDPYLVTCRKNKKDCFYSQIGSQFFGFTTELTPSEVPEKDTSLNLIWDMATWGDATPQSFISKSE